MSPAGGPGGGMVRTRGTVVIDVDACKGCLLCIDACPVDVLVMTEQLVNARGYRYPMLLAGCTGCTACSQVCPDFVFQVYKYETPIELVHGAGAGTDAGDPGGRS